MIGIITKKAEINITINNEVCSCCAISYKKDINLNRKEYLMAFKDDNGKTNYKPILGLSTDRYVK